MTTVDVHSAVRSDPPVLRAAAIPLLTALTVALIVACAAGAVLGSYDITVGEILASIGRRLGLIRPRLPTPSGSR